jgi:ABC-type amino acid transport substrate-binding protein
MNLISGVAILATCVSGSLYLSASTSASASSAATGLLGKVDQTHQLSIAMSAYAPEDFETSSGWSGYDVNILTGFAKSLGAKLVINPLPFASTVVAVSTKRDDLTIDIYYTPARAKEISFSRPMLNYTDAVAVNGTKSEVKSPMVADLTGKSIGVVIGSAEVTEAKAVPKATVIQYDNITDSFLALSSGKIAAVFVPDVDISWSKHENPSLDIKLLGPVPAKLAPPIASLRGYYGVPKGSYSTSFSAALNSYLKNIACNGKEQKILDKYNMTSPQFLAGICKVPNTP